VATSNDEDRRKAVQYGDQRVERGHGVETHQIATGSSPRLTTQQARSFPTTRTRCGRRRTAVRGGQA
jgi:hypothetical protein